MERLSTDTVFETLSNRRRRYALHYLKRVGSEDPVTIRDLSEQLAAWENGIDKTEVRPKQRKRLYTALHQTHLPQMHRHGIVDYDKNRGVVTVEDPLTEFDIYFDLVTADDVPWSQFYLGLSLLGAALVGAAVLGVYPFTSFGGYGYAIAVTLLFLGVAVYHTYRDRRRVLGTADDPPELTSTAASHLANLTRRRRH
jgi:hypothetical protein